MGDERVQYGRYNSEATKAFYKSFIAELELLDYFSPEDIFWEGAKRKYFTTDLKSRDLIIRKIKRVFDELAKEGFLGTEPIGKTGTLYFRN